MSFSGSWNAVANTPVRGTLSAQAVIWRSYLPAAAPRWSPCGGFQETNERNPADSSPAADDAAKLEGRFRSKLRRMLSGPRLLSARRNMPRSGPSQRPGMCTAAPTARHPTSSPTVGCEYEGSMFTEPWIISSVATTAARNALRHRTEPCRNDTGRESPRGSAAGSGVSFRRYGKVMFRPPTGVSFPLVLSRHAAMDRREATRPKGENALRTSQALRTGDPDVQGPYRRAEGA